MNTDAIDPDAVPIRPAATVIPLRDGDDAVEVLVLQRDAGLAFHGGSWVFPGGRVDDHELAATGGDDLAAARLAAVREAEEEAGLDLVADELVTLSHWTTPFGRNRRFATWFFVAHAPDGDIVIDDGEIRAFGWHPIDAAIEGCERGEISLAGPTYVSLLRLRAYTSVADALTTVIGRPDEIFLPKLVRGEGGNFSLYQNDPGYHTEDVEAAGPRHRMHMQDVGYRYINDLDPPPTRAGKEGSGASGVRS